MTDGKPTLLLISGILGLFGLILGFPFALQAEIYKYVDKRGNIHFSDRPFEQPGAGTANAGGTGQASSKLTTALRIYKYVDGRGVVHLTDRPPDSRYKLIYSGKTLLRPDASIFTKGGGYERYAEMVNLVAKQTGLESALIHAVITAESAYNSEAISPKGAVGLMQLMPGTAKRYGVSDSTDPYSNIDGGSRYLKDLLAMFNNNLRLALAAYNAGENAVIRYGRKIPPYKETRNYVAKVMQLYHAYRVGE